MSNPVNVCLFIIPVAAETVCNKMLKDHPRTNSTFDLTMVPDEKFRDDESD